MNDDLHTLRSMRDAIKKLGDDVESLIRKAEGRSPHYSPAPPRVLLDDVVETNKLKVTFYPEDRIMALVCVMDPDGGLEITNRHVLSVPIPSYDDATALLSTLVGPDSIGFLYLNEGMCVVALSRMASHRDALIRAGSVVLEKWKAHNPANG